MSVIIPVFGDQGALERCLAALAEQSWPAEACEVIVVDNGSIPPIQIDNRFAHLCRAVLCTRPGAYAARNAGVGEARGTVLAFTDADCEPDADWLCAGVIALARGRGHHIIGGGVEMTSSANPTAIERYQGLTGFLQRENIEARGFTATANLFVYREQFESIGCFDEDLLSGGDREWCWRAAQQGFVVEYAPQAAVTTAPRRSLAAAMRQARRVAGGRDQLRRMGLAHTKPAGLRPHRTAGAAAMWILTHPELSTGQRARVFGVATLLKLTQWMEYFRLRLGLRAERR